MIYETEIGDFNILGSDYRDFLALRYPESELVLRRELTDGCGHYEGGVLGIRWLSDHEILVERAIADHREDIIYDTTAHAWYAFQERPSPTPENTPIGDPDCPWDTAIRFGGIEPTHPISDPDCDDDTVIQGVGEKLMPPKLIKKVEPEIPEEYKDQKIKVTICIYEAVITAEGNVCGLKLMRTR